MLLDSWHKFTRKKRLRRQVTRAAARQSTPVIIFQMGKVASSTIEATLQPMAGLEILRTHGLARWETVSEEPSSRRDLESWLILHRLVRPGLPCKVITVVRDPIARNLSAYFQNLDQLLGVRRAHTQLTVTELVEGFFACYPHAKPLEWFDVEFRATLGIDIFQHPFDREHCFQRIQTPQFDVLILRTDADDTTKARQLAELVGTRELTMVQKNVGGNKSYASVYQEFLRTIRLPENYVREMLDHRFTCHFFTPVEIAKMRARWLPEGVHAPADGARGPELAGWTEH